MATETLTVPVVAGEGLGVELWTLVRPLVETAAKKAYPRGRKLVFEEVSADAFPEAAKKARLGLRGPLSAPGARAVRRAAGLVSRKVRVGPGENAPVVFHSIVEGGWGALELPAGGVETAGFLSGFRALAPRTFTRLRFGSRERTESYLRASGRRETALVELAVALRPASLEGFVATFGRAVSEALERKLERALLVHDDSAWTMLEEGVRFHAFGVGPTAFGEKLLTSWAYERLAQIEGKAVAEEVREELRKLEGLFLEYTTTSEVVHGTVDGAPMMLATPNAAELLVPFLAEKRGLGLSSGCAALADLDGLTVFETLHGTAPGLVGTDRASPVGFLAAAAELLRHAGWQEAAARLETAIERTVESGKGTADLLRRGKVKSAVGTKAFCDALGRAVEKV